MDRTVRWRTDHCALQLIFGREPAFDEFAFLRLGFVQFAKNLGPETLFGLEGLQPRLVDFVAGLRDLRRDLPVKALHSRGVPLQGSRALHRDELLLQQVLDAFQLACRDGHLPTVRLLLRLKTGDLLVELIDPALSKVLFAAARDCADREKVALRVEEAIAFKGGDLCGERGWPARLGGSVAFGIEFGQSEAARRQAVGRRPAGLCGPKSHRAGRVGHPH